MSRPRIVAAGDSVLVVEFEARIDPIVNGRAIWLAERIRVADITGVRDIVPTYSSVAVFFDPLRTKYDDLRQRLEHEAGREPGAAPAPRQPLRVPVCYGGELGPDLDNVARHAKMSPEQVVAVHSSGTYHVFMLGFLPGFAYMGLLDPRLAAPRHSTPRARVARGSVGIAGRQTGIYPADTSGGWQLLGRTPVRPFDLDRRSPFLFRPGDAVQFVPVDRSEFERLAQLEPDTASAIQIEPNTGYVESDASSSCT
jgi:KipI family sensor histidine kinase inhibitor